MIKDLKSGQYKHNKNRSDFTEHSIQNNKDLTPGLSGQFVTANDGQGRWFYQLTIYSYRVFRFHLFKAGFVTNLIWTFHHHILGCDDLPLPIPLQPGVCPH
jgi:hypothetical protein